MRITDPEFYDIATREFALLDSIKGHPNIMQVYDIFYNKLKAEMSILIEYSGNGLNLNDYVKKSHNKPEEYPLDEDLIKQTMKMLLTGL